MTLVLTRKCNFLTYYNFPSFRSILFRIISFIYIYTGLFSVDIKHQRQDTNKRFNRLYDYLSPTSVDRRSQCSTFVLPTVPNDDI